MICHDIYKQTRISREIYLCIVEFYIQCALYTSYYTFSFLHNSFFMYFMYIITKFSFVNFFKRFVRIILDIFLTTFNFYSKLMSQK